MKVGQHEYHFEEPDLVVQRMVGDVRAEHLEEIYSAARVFAQGKPRLFWLVDLGEAGSLGPDERKLMALRMRDLPCRGTVILNSGFMQRILSTMVMSTMRLFGIDKEHPVVFLDDEAAGRAWLAARRRELERRGL